MKGQMMKLDVAIPMIAIFTGIMIILAIGADVTNRTRGTLYSDGTTVTNQTITIDGTTNNTFIALAEGQVQSIVSLSNLTLVFTSGNYTVTNGDIDGGLTPTISCASCVSFAAGAGSGSSFNVTYTIRRAEGAFFAANNATTGIGNLQGPAAGTAIGASILVGLVFLGIFTFMRMKEGRSE